MTRKSQLVVWTLGALAAAAMVLVAAGATLSLTSSGASAAGAHKTSALSPAQAAKAERTRANFERMLAGLRGVVIQMRANPATAKSFKSTGTKLLPRIAAARKQVAKLDPAELAQLETALDQDPNWQQAPKTLSRAVAAFDVRRRAASTKGAAGALAPSAAISGSGTYTDDCLSAGDPVAETIAALVANEAQSALQAAALAAPGVIALFPGIDAPTGIRLGLMVAWGVADAVYLGLAQTLAVSVDCAQTAFSNTQESVLSEDPEGSGTIVPTSTQFSIDRLIQKAGNTQATINAVQTTVHTVQTQTDAVDAAVTALNTTLDDITNRVDEVKSDLQTLQTRVDILQNTEVSILKKSDTEISNLSSFQDLQLRIKIEQNLALNGNVLPLGIFQLPARFGGYLELVKSIVTDTLATAAANGNASAQALTYLNAANAAFTSGQYKSAYTLYAKAYNVVR
jgi:hypothetical protein